MSIAIALIQLDDLIAGMEAKSEIPVQLSELKMLKQLIESDSRSVGTKPTKVPQMLADPNVIGMITQFDAKTHTIHTKPITAKEFYKDLSEAQPPLRAVPLSLFPTMNSLQAVVDLAYSQLPVTDNNTMNGLLMTYHNTLLHILSKPKHYQD